MNGTCYYFQSPYSKIKTFRDSRTYCKTIFGNNINGRIFEPRSKEQMILVFKEAKNFSSGVFYIGVTNLLSSSEFRYDSDNELVSMEMPISPPSSKGVVCASCLNNNQVHWERDSGNCCCYLICEVA